MQTLNYMGSGTYFKFAVKSATWPGDDTLWEAASESEKPEPFNSI